MDSLNRLDAEERIARISDRSIATNGDGKAIREHVKAIRKSAHLEDPTVQPDTAFDALVKGGQLNRRKR